MPAQDPKRDWEQHVRDAATWGEDEVRRIVTYINNEVVPEVRRNGSVALRRAAVELEKLARRMDDHHRAAAGKDTPKS